MEIKEEHYKNVISELTRENLRLKAENEEIKKLLEREKCNSGSANQFIKIINEEKIRR
ncbi:MAG: hypothetical protein HDR11_05065 [Lachnospiraceae bacterium]|nr:hypothetical protein [Lachnospiraceae bacterium]